MTGHPNSPFYITLLCPWRANSSISAWRAGRTKLCPARDVGVSTRGSRQRCPSLQYSQNAIDHDGIGDIFELSHADFVDGEESGNTPCCLRANEDRSRLTDSGDPSRHIRYLAQR